MVLRIFQFGGDIDFVGAGGRPLSLDVVPGARLSATWTLSDAEPFEVAGLEGFRLVDCVHMLSGGEFALLSERAVRVVRPFFQDWGEFLPMRLLGRAYWWFNCLAVFYGLDESAALIDWDGAERFFAPGRTWPFDTKRVAAAPPVFRVPQSSVGDVFVRGEVAAAIVEAGLTGFDLCPVWPSGRDEPGRDEPGPIGLRDDLAPGERERLVRAKRRAVAVSS